MSAVQNGASIAIIVLNWNGRDLTLDCLRSLAAVTTPHVRIILVDNASTDGSSDAVRQHYGSRVTLIENAQNLGFAAGNNVGIRRALDDGADFILLLNNDTVVAPDFVEHLHRPMLSSPDIGITAPKIYYAEPKNQIWFAGGELSMWRGIARHTGIRETDRGQYDHRGERRRAGQQMERRIADAVGQAPPRGERPGGQFGSGRSHARGALQSAKPLGEPFTTPTPNLHIS